MGLDVTAYRQLFRVDDAEVDEDGSPVDWQNYWRPGGSWRVSEKEWPGRAKEIDPDAIYGFKESFDFRAGSYSGYNEWRNELANFAGYKGAKDVWQNVPQGPFVELINFSDCEGVIGAALAAKLADDFARMESELDNWLPSVYAFDIKYREWRRAFGMASDHGAVLLH